MAAFAVLAVPAQMVLGAVSGPAPEPGGPDAAAVRRAYAALPVAFEANRGQVDSSDAFVARGSGYAFLVGARGATLAFTPGGAHRVEPAVALAPAPPLQTMRIELIGADPRAAAVTGEPAGTTSSFLGGDGSRWHTGIPDYARYEFREVYPGIDLVYHGLQGSLEYDFVVAPGADPQLIRLRVDGAPVAAGPAGEVALALPGGTAVQHPASLLQPPVTAAPAHPRTTAAPLRAHPAATPRHRGGLPPAATGVGGGFLLGHGGELHLRLGDYDRTRPLVIDPLVTWAPALGGGVDESFVSAVDRAQSSYVVTATPVPGATSAATTLTDVAVLKLDRDGRVVYRTFLDGGGTGAPTHAAVDDSGALDISGPAPPVTGPVLTGGGPPRYTMHLDPRGLPLPRTGAPTY